MCFLVKDISPKRRRMDKNVCQFFHNKLCCSNYTKASKQYVSKDVWEYYLQIQISWEVRFFTEMSSIRNGGISTS